MHGSPDIDELHATQESPDNVDMTSAAPAPSSLLGGGSQGREDRRPPSPSRSERRDFEGQYALADEVDRSRGQNCRCLLTQTAVGVNWVSIMPQQGLCDRMAGLGLIPPAMPLSSTLNLIPLASHASSFETGLWTLYPSTSVLLQLIALEELQFKRRKIVLDFSKHDPGRSSYRDSYAALERTNPFSVFFHPSFPDPAVPRVMETRFCRCFSDHHGRGAVDDAHAVASLDPFPELELLASPNIIVRMRTGALPEAMDPQAKKHKILGSYLLRLWDADPARGFGPLERPDEAIGHPLVIEEDGGFLAKAPPPPYPQPRPDRAATLPPTSSYPKASPKAEMGKSARSGSDNSASTLCEKDGRAEDASRGRKKSASEGRGKTFTFDGAGDGKGKTYALDNAEEGGQPRSPAGPMEGRNDSAAAGRGMFTANEWAMALTGTNLGGDMWNYQDRQM